MAYRKIGGAGVQRWVAFPFSIKSTSDYERECLGKLRPSKST